MIFEHRINDDLRLLKYSLQTVFERNWNEETIRARGLVVDNDDNVIANCIPKFFNLEEPEAKNINWDQPFTVTEKVDGSLIQVFMYKGEMIITSSGSSNNKYTQKAEELLNSKYEHLLPIIHATDCVNFIFELIAPFNRVVVDYDGIEELRLITIREQDGTEDEDFIQQCHDLGFNYVKEVHFDSIEDMVKEKHREDFINQEGFVIKFQDGNRIKVKYKVYFDLHRVYSGINDKTIWKKFKLYYDFEQNYEDNLFRLFDLKDVPDEFLDDLKQSAQNLWIEFLSQEMIWMANYHSFMKVYDKEPTDKEYALDVMKKLEDSKDRSMMFAIRKNNEHAICKLLWDYVYDFYFIDHVEELGDSRA